MAGRFKVEAIFKAVDNITAPVTRMSNKIGMMTRSAEKDINRLDSSMNRFGSGARRSLGYMTVALGGIAYAYKDILSTGMDFDQAMADTGAKLGNIDKAGDVYKRLAENAREAGRATEFTARQAAYAQRELARSGFKESESKFSVTKSLPYMIDFATASGMQLDEAASAAVDIMGSFGYIDDKMPEEEKMKGLLRASNLINKVANDSNQTVVMLHESTKRGPQLGTQIGQTMEDYMTFTKFLADSNIKATQQGTVVKRLNTAIYASTPEGREAMNILEVVPSTEETLRDPVVVLEEMMVGLQKLEEGLKPEVLKMLFGQVVLPGGAALTHHSKSLREYRQSLYDLDQEFTKKQAAYMRDTLLGRFRALISAIESVKISTTELNKKGLADTIDLMTKWVRINESLIADRLNRFLAFFIDNLQTIIRLLKFVGIFSMAWLPFVIGVKTAAIAMEAHAIAAIVFSSAYGIVAVAIGALVAAVILCTYYFDELILTWDKLSWFGKWLVRIFFAPVISIMYLVGAVKTLLNALNELMDAWDRVKDSKFIKPFYIGPDPDVWHKSGLNVPGIWKEGEEPDGWKDDPISIIKQDMAEQLKGFIKIGVEAMDGTKAEVMNDDIPNFLEFEQTGAFAQ